MRFDRHQIITLSDLAQNTFTLLYKHIGGLVDRKKQIGGTTKKREHLVSIIGKRKTHGQNTGQHCRQEEHTGDVVNRRKHRDIMHIGIQPGTISILIRDLLAPDSSASKLVFFKNGQL